MLTCPAADSEPHIVAWAYVCVTCDRHSSVYACKDVDGQPVVLKCYHKHLMESRHYRNVRRELHAMQTATECRYAALRSSCLADSGMTHYGALMKVSRCMLSTAFATKQQPPSPEHLFVETDM